MSVRAYIIREDSIWIGKSKDNLIEYIHTDKEYYFSLWSQDHIRKLILKYGGNEWTNEECIGKIEIGLDDFEALYENEYFEGDDLESIELMKKYFDEGHYILTLECW